MAHRALHSFPTRRSSDLRGSARDLVRLRLGRERPALPGRGAVVPARSDGDPGARAGLSQRSEEHTSELQSRQYLVCRLLLEKKKYTIAMTHAPSSRSYLY